jgi:NAD(P)-dependent dehydrogenase (short-subunit alcohol dehydrogenase family)
LVAAIDRDPDQARLTASMITDNGGVGLSVVADVTREDEVAAAVATVQSELGVPSVLHNNVGATTTGDVTEVDLAAWEQSLRINLGGVFLACKHTIPSMIAAGRGSIVNVSSIAGIRWTGYPYPAYMAAKAAVNQLTVALALRYAAQGVRVNAVLPGLIDTPMAAQLSASSASRAEDEATIKAAKTARDARSPTGRSGTPWDVAHAAAFLASDEAGYINAVCLPVDGGISAGCP